MKILLNVFFMVFSLFTISCSSKNDSFKTNNEGVLIDPVDTRYLSFENYLSTIDNSDFQAEEIYRSAENKSKRISIIVNKDLYANVLDSVSIYVGDLEKDGYFVILSKATNSKDHSGLKSFIKDQYLNDSIQGVTLIGQLPVAWFEHVDPITNSNKEYPCDWFFMDLDGVWKDNDSDNIYDFHYGNHQPEIFVSRIIANNLTFHNANETDLIKNYFIKNHKYRIGELRLEDKAFTPLGEDWRDNGYEQGISKCYPDNTIVNAHSDDFRSYLKEESGNKFESVLLCSHSSVVGHYFGYSNSGRSDSSPFMSEEVEELGVQALFINMFACNSARFTENDSLGTWYIMQSKYGLNVVGSTVSGSMRDFDMFYIPMAQGKSMGESLKNWGDICMDPGMESFYGIVMLGDPALRIGRYMDKPVVNEIIPSIPKNLKLSSVSSGAAYLNWETSDNAEYYVIERTDNTRNIVKSFVTEYSYYVDIDNVEPSTEYQYKIKSVNKTGESDFSTILVVETLSPELNVPTANVYGRYEYIKINNSYVSGYIISKEIWRSDTENGEYTKIGNTAFAITKVVNTSLYDTANTFYDKSAEVGKKYFYKTRAVTYTQKGDFTGIISGERSPYKSGLDYLYLNSYSFPIDPVKMNLVADNTWQAIVDLTNQSDLGFRFWLNGGNWWGLDKDEDGKADDHGDDITLKSGKVYTINFNDSTLEYSIDYEKDKNYDIVYFRGTANEWLSSPMELIDNNIWQIMIKTKDEENQRFKFDIKGDWSLNFGDNDQDNMADQSGSDINLSPGTDYIINFNDLTKEYEIIEDTTLCSVNLYYYHVETLTSSSELQGLVVKVYRNGSQIFDEDGSDFIVSGGGYSGPQAETRFSKLKAGIYKIVIDEIKHAETYYYDYGRRHFKGELTFVIKNGLTYLSPSPTMNVNSEEVFLKPVLELMEIDSSIPSVKISWNDLDIEKTEIYRSESQEVDYEIIGESTGSLFYEDLSVENNKTYYYKIKCYTNDQEESELSDFIEAKVPAKNIQKTYEQVYLRGTNNGWIASDTSKMSLVKDFTWEMKGVQFGSTSEERFKFDINGDWFLNFGDTNNDGIADQSGDDIKVQLNKKYTITFNDKTKVYSLTIEDDMEEFKSSYEKVYLRGTCNDWQKNEMTLVSDNTWEIMIDFNGSTDSFKFDASGDWSINFGDNNNDNYADSEGADIMVSDGSGSYKITFNDQSMYYFIEKK